jgi:NAD(P)-dependent dehydrogenase (short-subunit alcohol dehydrogenase family)
VVTGGARGVGRSIALRLARDGTDVALVDLDGPGLEAVAGEVRELGREALELPADVASDEDVNALAEAVFRTFGHVDLLVNNAAVIGPTAPAAEVRRADWERVLAVNLTGPLLCCQAVLPGMIARGSGKIVNVASVAGKTAYPFRSPYAVSKWGLIGLTLTLAKELGPHNIQVNAVCPGPVAGDRMRKVIRARAAELGRSVEEVERDYHAAAALGRMVQPEDVAAVVALLASPEGDNITGQAIDVSAGYGL